MFSSYREVPLQPSPLEHRSVRPMRRSSALSTVSSVVRSRSLNAVTAVPTKQKSIMRGAGTSRGKRSIMLKQTQSRGLDDFANEIASATVA